MSTILLNKLCAIIFSCLIFLNAYVVKCYVKTWLFPACIFALFNFAYTFFPLVVLFAVPVDAYAVFYILGCTIIFSFSTLLFNWKAAFQANRRKLIFNGKYFGTSFLRKSFVTCQCAVIITIFINLAVQDLSIYEYLYNFFETSNEYLAKRYNGKISWNIFFNFGTVLNFLGVTLGGMMLSSFKSLRKQVSIIFLALLPSVLFMLIYADKGTLFLAIAFLYAGVLVSRIYANDFSITNKATNRAALFSFLIVVPLLMLAFLARGIYVLNDTQEITLHLVSYFSSYVCGHLYAFSDWFSAYFFGNSLSQGYYNVPSIGTLGFYTFSALFKVFGYNIQLPPGTYDDYYTFKTLLKSNIYTMYRGLILDYGFFGNLVFMLIFGYLFNAYFYILLRSRASIFAIAAFCLFFGISYHSYLISLMMYGGVYVYFFLLAAVLFFNKHFLILART